MDAVTFVKEQHYLISKKDFTSLRCMDDRYEKAHEPLADYAVPGGGLGILADAISGIETILPRPLSEAERDAIAVIVEKIIGLATFHTANHGKVAAGCPAGGCGYLAGSLQGYAYLSKESAAYLTFLANELLAQGYEPACFEGGHEASYVLLIFGFDIGIIPTAADGTRAYVINVDVRDHLLEKIAGAVYDQIEMLENDIVSREVLVNAMKESGRLRLNEVVHDLGADTLPVYDVMRVDGEVTAVEHASANETVQ